MKKLVYDLPTRLFHWLFAFLFLFAFIIGKNVDDESPTYVYHMMAGLGISFIVLLRIIWGFIGSKHARFSGFVLHPKSLIQYMKGIFTGQLTRYTGHNPASSWAAIVMMILALCLGTTGYLMTSTEFGKETYEDFHEIFANAFIILVITHIAGIILHTIRHKELISLSMIIGTKDKVKDEDVIPHSYRLVAVLFIILYFAFSSNIAKNYNLQDGRLNFFGTILQLGENSSEEVNATSTQETHPKQNEDLEDEVDTNLIHEQDDKTLESEALKRGKQELNDLNQQGEDKE